MQADLHVHLTMLVALHEINGCSELLLHHLKLLVHGKKRSLLQQWLLLTRLAETRMPRTLQGLRTMRGNTGPQQKSS